MCVDVLWKQVSTFPEDRPSFFLETTGKLVRGFLLFQLTPLRSCKDMVVACKVPSGEGEQVNPPVECILSSKISQVRSQTLHFSFSPSCSEIFARQLTYS